MDTTGVGIGPARLELRRSIDETGQVRLTMIGEVDISNLEQLHTAIHDVVAEPEVTSLVLDLQPLDFIDSAGVQVLLRAKRSAERRRVSFGVVNAHGKVLRVLTILNLHGYLVAPGPVPR
ncbi:STAS domain-containing protein [Planosporangium sp. 12N6]|uniref:STAS domain-containing protein n=1 Tax=Planosporangium spinosum TaxID=3402278 RepID=UPI003CED8CCD